MQLLGLQIEESVCFVQHSVAASQCQAILYVFSSSCHMSLIMSQRLIQWQDWSDAAVISITCLGYRELRVWTCSQLMLFWGALACRLSFNLVG